MRWFSAPKLAGLPGLPTTRRGVHHRAKAEGWQYRTSTSQGGETYEYRSTDLPLTTQQHLAVQAAGAVKPAADAQAAAIQAKQAAQVQACASSMAKYGVILEAKGGFDPARNPKLDLFQRFESYHAMLGGSVWTAVCEFTLLWNDGCIESLPATRVEYPRLAAKTLDKWCRAWRTRGVEALLERKPRKDKGQNALTSSDALYDTFLAAVSEMHDPNARQVQRVIRSHLGEQNTPSTSTLKRWLKDFKDSNAPALLMFKNPDGYKNKYRPAFGTQGDDITRPNQEWQQDSTVGDAQQRVEMAFNMADPSTGEIRRHAIVASIDVFTRRAKVVVARTSSSNAVKAVTRACVLAWGMPERIKTDNGKDYTAQDYEFALSMLKIEHRLCTPFSPEQKPYVERFIGTLMHDLFPMLEGFVGKSIAERKAIESAKSFAQRFGLGGIDLNMGPTQLQGVIDGWLDEYHSRRHSELGCSPNEMAERHTTKVVRMDERALDILLMPVAGKGTRVVAKRGIALGSGWFAAPELAAYIGTTVRCRQDDQDLGALHVFAMDGTYICRALDHTMLGINRAELAAKARAIETATIKPMVDRLRKSMKKGLTKQAVQSLYAEREASAAEQTANVHRLPPREVQHTTPAIDSVVAHLDTSSQDAAREQARAMLDAQPALPTAKPAEVRPMTDASPIARYSAWVRLHARMERGEQISQREQEWATSYQSSKEFVSWHELHEGQDPLGEVATGS
ncbi:DNA-binding protein [Rhodoferax sp.]|uniref:DNA-binding protein n=1 Tax=Rhodoferax sp. TaxID=50421 RepID=UPI002ACE56A4|nr:DNA-binding protein [Rhodoferax sp.]MDZ7920733.1 DDE-type integrase/transposase/recombinase [Rhodoferax sp.]